MKRSLVNSGNKTQARHAGTSPARIAPDYWVLMPALLLTCIGLVMVGSASVAVAEGHGVSAWHYLVRHAMFIAMGVTVALSLRIIPIRFFERISRPMMLLATLSLLVVLVPGLGYTVNGSTRWIRLGMFNFQVVEAVKLMVIIYLAGYLARKTELVKSRFFDTLKPLILAATLSLILMVQPDMGSAAIVTAIIFGMVWLAGAAWRHIFLLGALALPAFGWAAMEPYRLRRIVSFLDPWSDPYNSGFQLTQALIAVGRGEWAGVGLGASIQKLFYLPEAHTDFIFAVLGEEFGFLGVLVVLALFLLLVTRIMIIGLMAHRSGRAFAGFLAYGIGLWIGLQALVSIGVNLGVLPTKGLTLPLISSGGSSVLMTILAIAVVLRVKYELDRDGQVAVAGRPRNAGRARSSA